MPPFLAGRGGAACGRGQVRRRCAGSIRGCPAGGCAGWKARSRLLRRGAGRKGKKGQGSIPFHPPPSAVTDASSFAVIAPFSSGARKKKGDALKHPASRNLSQSWHHSLSLKPNLTPGNKIPGPAQSRFPPPNIFLEFFPALPISAVPLDVTP